MGAIILNIAIIDDLQNDRNMLSNFSILYCKENNILFKIECFESGEKFLQHFKYNLFDIIFLDIYMDKLDGIQTAEKIREKDNKCLIIFSTTSENHAIKSFRVKAFNYLLKPFEYEQFEEVMNLCDNTLIKYSAFIEIKERRNIIKIMVSDIIYTDYYNHYIQIHVNERVIKTYMKFSEFSIHLLKHSQFLCCYRNCIINMDFVAKLDKKDFIMENGEKIPIKRANGKYLRQLYADYIFKKLNGGM